jgi:hypothetical protein
VSDRATTGFGLDKPRATVRLWVEVDGSSSPVPLSLEHLLGQQQIADTLHRMQLIPRAIRVAEAHWQPRMAG